MTDQQTHIEGMEPEIDDIALKYVKTRDRRMKLTDDEVQLREKIRDRMHEHELASYVLGDGPDRMIVSVEASEERVRVKKYIPPKVDDD